MGQRITIEKWAENLEEVTIGRWLKTEGDHIEAGEVLCEIITDKVTFEYTMEDAGTVAKIYASEASVIPVGYVIAFISAPGEEADPTIEQHNEATLTRYRRQAQPDLDLDAILGAAKTKRPRRRATPAARRLARRSQIELQDVAEARAEPVDIITENHVREYLSRTEQDDPT